MRDFHTLALLPEHALAARLGEAGTRLQQLARGADLRTLALCKPREHFEEAMELESAVETLEPLSFLLNRLLEQLCARLEARALAVQELRLRLQLEPRVADEQTTTLQELAAARNTSVFPDRRRWQSLRAYPASASGHARSQGISKAAAVGSGGASAGSPVCKLWITAEPARPRSAQRGLFLPITPEAEKLEITLARITGVVGERRAGIAKLLDTHRPDAFRMERFVSQQEQGNGDHSLTLSDTTEFPPVALRIFRPACQVRVHLAEGRPCKLAALAQSTDRNELRGKILWSAGPWRSSGDWWAEQAAAKNAGSGCASLEPRRVGHRTRPRRGTDSIALYRIYRDAEAHWFADASYPTERYHDCHTTSKFSHLDFHRYVYRTAHPFGI